ncbi:uncharacterized protein BJ212DRAFT_1306025 [Suillus subaureus]|uniref:Uncharacterized protein n=1 Tax=Suillus subaureus TaxID=48587 RepID=A0A9P7IYJ2_9AGAM|nr:uncharacterized protein BJ212DRAFT_1306025 [Suillus subaureus]KAG1797260.1 hypothetical protein BJ212DRAFT_1306025 [Suillus subaureus]
MVHNPLILDLTYGNMEDELHAYLSNCHCLNDWKDPKNSFVNIKAKEDNNEEQEADEDDVKNEDIEIEDGEPKCHMLTLLPRIKDNLHTSSSSSGYQLFPIAPAQTTGFIFKRRVYAVSINVPARQFLTEHFEKEGFKILYIMSNNPQTFMTSIPQLHGGTIKKWQVLSKDKETTVNTLHLKFPSPAWLRIKHGKYKDTIGYIFNSKQTNNFVTVLIPPREFPYNMPKGSVVLFDPSCLPTGILPSDVTHDGKVVASKYKSKEYYCGLLKKNFHQYCTELVVVPHPDNLHLHL